MARTLREAIANKLRYYDPRSINDAVYEVEQGVRAHFASLEDERVQAISRLFMDQSLSWSDALRVADAVAFGDSDD